MSVEDNKALARRFFAVIQTNVDELDTLLPEDYVHHDPGLPPQFQHGRENYKQVVSAMFGAFPDLVCDIESIIAEGDKVALRMRWHGTHTGPLFGMPPSGKPVDFSMMVIQRVESGRIAEQWVNFDTMGMMQQIGAIPAPEGATT